MTSEHSIAFFLFSIVAAVTPGPSNLILASTGANTCELRGLPSLFGVAFGMGTMIFFAASGFGNFVIKYPIILYGFKICSMGFILWLSWNIITSEQKNAISDKEFLGFWGAALFQWVNPKAWLVCVSAAGTYMLPEDGTTYVQPFYFSLLFVLAALPCGFLWLSFGASLKRILSPKKSVRVFNLAIGLILACSVLMIIR